MGMAKTCGGDDDSFIVIRKGKKASLRVLGFVQGKEFISEVANE